jgi:hypothetical protein
MTNCKEIIFSQRACNSIASESISRKPNEAAGILLGTVCRSNWYVVEAIDLGLNYIISATHITYDSSYVTHLLRVVSRQYLCEIEILGFWFCIFRSCKAFSSIENKTNLSLGYTNEKGAISCLVHMDPTIRVTMYHERLPRNYKEVSYKIGDDLLPEEILKYKHQEDIRIINFNQYCQAYVISPR